VRIVHLVRDPKAVAYSLANPKPDPSLHGKLMPSRSPTQAALIWMNYNLAFERLAARGNVVRVRYEDLVRAPKNISARLELAAPTGNEVVTGAHSVAGNPWRFSPEASLQLDERWRSGLGPKARRTVQFVTYPLRLRYGY